MIPYSLSDVKNFLSSKHLEMKDQKETDQIYAMLTVDGKEYPFFVRAIEDAKLIQTIAFLPFEFKEEHVNETARLLLLFNKELSHPGFGIDEDNHVIFFRCLIPAVNGKLSETLLKTALEATKNALQIFTGSIFAIGTGQITYKDLMEKAQKQSSHKKGKS